jgi:rSAM/selenodomain-associated transferase 2
MPPLSSVQESQSFRDSCKPLVTSSPRLSIIVPFLEDRTALEALGREALGLEHVGCASRECEWIVVDGGSAHATLDWLATQSWIDRVVKAPRGRAAQMNAGARVARGEMLWFLHADSGLQDLIRAGGDGFPPISRLWGRFDVRLSGAAVIYRLIEAMMNLRSCWTGIATGDQGIFVHRELFFSVGGFPELPLMEDIAISRLLRKHVGRPICMRRRIVTSSRRWEQRGVLRTIALMWMLRLGYWLGVDPRRLARWYR